MKNALGAILLIFGGSPALADASRPPPPMYIDTSLAKVGNWEIGFNPTTKGCVAAVTVTDNTTFWFGYANDAGSFPYIAFSNASWNVDRGKLYSLRVVFHYAREKPDIFVGEFVGTSEREAGVVVPIGEEVLNHIAHAQSVEVIGDQGQLAGVNLGDSRAALDTVVECQGHAPELIARSAKKEEPQGPITGTGFFVSNGHVLTNYHVAGHCAKTEIRVTDGSRHPALLIKGDPENDLALLFTDVASVKIANFEKVPRLGESAFVFGFPLAGLLSSSGSFTSGNVNSLAGLGDDARMLQVSAPVQPGNSGGPLLNERGAVIGIVTSKANTIAIASVTNDISQNINFAIRSSVAMDFLESAGVHPKLSSDVVALSPPDIASEASGFSAQVICEQLPEPLEEAKAR
jgi:serine protease Do